MEVEKQYSLDELKDELNEKQKIFCHEYCVEWNATKSYKKAYGIDENDDNVAAAAGARLLRNVKIRQYIDFIKTDYEFLCGISKTKQIEELKKIAYSSIYSIHKTWIDLSEWEDIKANNPGVLDAVESIDTKTEYRNSLTDEGDITTAEVKYIKVKFHSKIAAIDLINKMMGYNEPERLDISSQGKKIKLNISKDE